MIRRFCDKCGQPLEGEEYFTLVRHSPIDCFSVQSWTLCRYCSVECIGVLMADVKKRIEADERADEEGADNE